eukprot:m.138131 g.138131  ORF g.138131 m.138131 type:complete len:893 (-) comp17018_c0_seq6:45-2723(-)
MLLRLAHRVASAARFGRVPATAPSNPLPCTRLRPFVSCLPTCAGRSLSTFTSTARRHGMGRRQLVGGALGGVVLTAIVAVTDLANRHVCLCDGTNTQEVVDVPDGAATAHALFQGVRAKQDLTFLVALLHIEPNKALMQLKRFIDVFDLSDAGAMTSCRLMANHTGLVEGLVTLLHTHDRQYAGPAAEILTWFAKPGPGSDAIRDAIFRLQGHLNLAAIVADDQADAPMLRRTLRLMSHLMHASQEHRRAFVQLGVIDHLVRVLSNKDQLSQLAAHALCNIAHTDSVGGRAVVAAGVLPVLVDTLRMTASCEDTQLHCLNMMKFVTDEINDLDKDELCGRKQTLFSHGAIVPLLKLMGHTNPAVSSTAAYVLCNLAQGQESRRKALFEHGAVQRVEELLSKSVQQHSAAIALMGCLLQTEERKQLFAQPRVVNQLVQLLYDDEGKFVPTETAHNILRSLVRLAYHSEERARTVAESNCQHAVCQALHCGVEELELTAAAVIWAVCRTQHGDDSRSLSFAKAGAVPLLADLIKQASDRLRSLYDELPNNAVEMDYTLLEALGAMSHLSFVHGLHTDIVATGLLRDAAWLLQHGHPRIVMEAMRLLRNLAGGDDSVAEAIISANCLDTIVHRVNNGSLTTRLRATAAIRKLARKELTNNKAYREAIRQTKGLDALQDLSEFLYEIDHNIHSALKCLDPSLHSNRPRLHADRSRKSHDIMISYCHSEKEMVHKIFDALVEHGWRVWLDEKDLSGKIEQSCRQAVRHAEIVVVCFSKAYQASANCRVEAQEAVQYRRDHMDHPKLVGCKVEKDLSWRPSDWLSDVVSSSLYYDFHNTACFDKSIPRLIAELEDHLPPPAGARRDRQQDVRSNASEAASKDSGASPSHDDETLQNLL